jgi:hypothetical protein
VSRATELEHERLALIEELYDIEQEALDVWTHDGIASLRLARDAANARINAIDSALAADDCTPTGEP